MNALMSGEIHFARLALDALPANLENHHAESAVTTPEAFAAFLKDDRERAGLVVKKYSVPRQ